MQVVSLAGLLADATGNDAIYQPLQCRSHGRRDHIIAHVFLDHLRGVEILNFHNARRHRRREVKDSIDRLTQHMLISHPNPHIAEQPERQTGEHSPNALEYRRLGPHKGNLTSFLTLFG